MFKDRLLKYRTETVKAETKKEMSDLLGVSQQLYAMFERGDRSPSKNFLNKLVTYSGLAEEYWLYGVTDTERITKRKEFKSIETTVLDLIEENYITNVDFSEDIKEILLTAIKADIQHLLLKRKK